MRSRFVLEWVALGALLVVLAGYLGLDLRASRQAIETTERDRLEHQAQVVEKMLGTRLQATVNALDSLRADAPAILSQADGTTRLAERMQVMVASMAGVRTFLLVNARGIAVASNRTELVGGDWREGERYRAISSHPDARALYLSPPFMTPLGNWALSLGRAIVEPGGAFGGYVLAIIDPEYFQLLLDSARYAPAMATAMIHGGGKIIYRVPDPNGAIGMDLSDRPDSAFGKHLRSGLELTSWTAPPGAAPSGMPALSADGRFVAFLTQAALDPVHDANGTGDVYLRDTCVNAGAACTPSTVLVSVAPGGATASGGTPVPHGLSADGRFVLFQVGTGGHMVRDTCAGATGCTPSTHQVSLDPDGVLVEGIQGALSGDGRWAVYGFTAPQASGQLGLGMTGF